MKFKLLQKYNCLLDTIKVDVACRLAEIVRISTLVDARSFFWDCSPPDATDDKHNQSESNILKMVGYG
jgi:hypothetical protein